VRANPKNLWTVDFRKVEIDVLKILIEWSQEDDEIPDQLKSKEFRERRESALSKLKEAVIFPNPEREKY
jgi:hypothetical protein